MKTTWAALKANRRNAIVRSGRGLASALLAVGAVLSMTGCQKAAQTAADLPHPKPIASIQELMLQHVDPAADRLWGAVSEHVDATGYHRTVPQTDAEWIALREEAVRLAETANLLATPGRLVAVHGGKVADEGSPGVLTTGQIQAQIDKDPSRFYAAAAKLQTETLGMAAAIDARSPDRLVDAGEKVDGACESCHLQFWYPPGEAPKAAAQVYKKPGQ